MLDFFVVCNLVLPHVTKMVVDEENKHVLTNYRTARTEGKAINSDHATEYMDLDLKICTEEPKRKVMWNFKNKDAQKKFKIMTSKTNQLSECFQNQLRNRNLTIFGIFCSFRVSLRSVDFFL